MGKSRGQPFLTSVMDQSSLYMAPSIDSRRFALMWLKKLKDRRRAKKLRKSCTMHVLQLLGSRFRKFCSVERADWEGRWR